jgi:hypothetical protein
MPFQISPGVNVSEIDLTTVVPAVSTTEGAIAGVFRWGPVDEVHMVSSEKELVRYYGTPTANNFETWFTAANFLAYGNNLKVVRAFSNTTFNSFAGSNDSVTTANVIVKNQTHYDSVASGFDTSNTYYLAKFPGVLGQSLKISVCDSANAYTKSLFTANATSTANLVYTINSNTAVLTMKSTVSNTAANTAANTFINAISVGDFIVAGNSSVGTQYLKVSAVGAPVLNTGVSNATVGFVDTIINFSGTYNLSQAVAASANDVAGPVRYWQYYNYFNGAPGTSNWVKQAGGSGDEMHIIVIDEDGLFTGANNQTLETFPAVSRASDAKGEQGGSNYYKDVLNQSSQYVWYAADRSGSLTTTAATSTALNTVPYTQAFRGGSDGLTESTATLAHMASAYDRVKSTEDATMSLLLTGKNQYGAYGEGLANYLIDNIAEYRKDCIVFISPKQENVVNNPGNELNSVLTFRNAIHSSSFAFIDSGYKYQYDKYNDKYRWVPLNGDVAGTVVRTDNVRDPWFSPAGFNRGQIKNLVKLAYNPDKANREALYKSDINPVVNFPGEGVILFGDKTALGKPSAFDRINVRRLFIVLEKAIAVAAKSSLFELNDKYTRAQFRNLVEPYLRDIKGRRGIYDFRVVCDDTNNTPERIDRNEFWGDIYIKPARSINFIQLNFIAVRTGVSFDTVVGNV